MDERTQSAESIAPTWWTVISRLRGCAFYSGDSVAVDFTTLNLKTFMDLQSPIMFDTSFFVIPIIGRGDVCYEPICFFGDVCDMYVEDGGTRSANGDKRC